MISFCNKKGGVGKTTITKNIAYKLALDGKKILLIDLDPQANLTMEFIDDEQEIKKTIMNIIATKDAIENISLKKVIINSKYKNIDLIAAKKELTKSSYILGTMYEKDEIYKISDMLYWNNKDIFDSYDYVMIDYPPTINELNLSFLVISDLIVVPINNALRALKGLLDLKNNLEIICHQEKREIPDLKILINNVKDNFYLEEIKKLIFDFKLETKMLNTKLKESEIFKAVENKLCSIWENPHYWRQKQAYEELIKEII